LITNSCHSLHIEEGGRERGKREKGREGGSKQEREGGTKRERARARARTKHSARVRERNRGERVRARAGGIERDVFDAELLTQFAPF